MDEELYDPDCAACEMAQNEAQRLAADIYNMQHKERLRQERALALQIQYGDAQ